MAPRCSPAPSPLPAGPARRRPPRARGAAPVLVLLAGSGCTISVDTDEYRGREEHRFAVSGAPAVTLATFDGAIEVRTWDRPEVLVEIEKRGPSKEILDTIEVVVEQAGDRIRVEARQPAHRSSIIVGVRLSPRARLVASVPRRCDLLARSGDGSITAERVSGRVELRTGDGRIRGIDLSGDLSVHTSDGPITLEAVDGRLDASTVDGGVRVEGTITALRLRSGDGSIRVRVDEGSAMAEDWDIETDDGGVTIELPRAFGAEIDARTGDGAIRVDEGLALRTTGDAGRRAVRGTLGTGGPRLRIRTTDGSISLRPS